MANPLSRHNQAILIAILLLLPLPGLAQTAWRDSVETALSRQMELYPESTLRDIYKNFFQGVFGPGHIIADRQSATKYLVSELEETDSVPTVTMFEPVGMASRYVRVDLSAIKSGLITKEQLIDALARSAAIPATMTVGQWAKEWKKIEALTAELYPGIPDFTADSQAIAELLAGGNYVSHHSSRFNDLYHPHYRLIATGIFERELLPLIERQQQ